LSNQVLGLETLSHDLCLVSCLQIKTMNLDLKTEKKTSGARFTKYLTTNLGKT